MVVAAVISALQGRDRDAPTSLKVDGILADAVVLILLQPDLGTGLVFVAITLGMLLVGGMKGRWFLVIALVGVRWPWASS